MSENLFDRSGILFARPSFIEGVARIIDFGGTLNIYNDSMTEALADRNALASDWQAVGDALQESLKLAEAKKL